MKKYLEKNKLSLSIILLVAMFWGVKLCAESLVDSSTQKSFISGNNQYYNATQQMGFYMCDTNTTGTTYLCYSSAETKMIEKIEVVGKVTYHTKAFDTWANKGTATYIPWNNNF